MAIETLKTLVLKTATVTGVKPATPADHIGLGLVVATANAYPTDDLSPGQCVLPSNPEPKQAWERQESSAMQLQQQMQAIRDHAEPPTTGSLGCFLGAQADGAAMSNATLTGWLPTKRTATARRVSNFTSSSTSTTRRANHRRSDFPRDLRHDSRLGCDCQSPDRLSGKRNATREVDSAATARK